MRQTYVLILRVEKAPNGPCSNSLCFLRVASRFKIFFFEDSNKKPNLDTALPRRMGTRAHSARAVGAPNGSLLHFLEINGTA